MKKMFIRWMLSMAVVGAAALCGIAAPEDEGGDVGGRSIQFNQSPLDVVLKAYGNLVNKTILKDPNAPSPTITLMPKQGQQLTDEDKIDAIETVLEMNGIHMEPYGEKFIRALPRKDARKEGIPLIMDPDAVLGESSKVVSLMVPFKHISVEDAQKTLDNFKSGSGIIIGFERTNSLLLTDTEANINRMREIARAIDIAMPVLENVFVRQIKNASATEIQEALQKIVEDSQKYLEKEGNKGVQQNAPSMPRVSTPGSRLLNRPGANPPPAAPVNNESLVMSISDADRGMIRGKVLIVPDERSNKLIIITSKSNMDFFDRVIDALDVETTPEVQVKVYRLKYADAEDVSDMINDLIGNSASSKGASGSKGNQNQNAKAGSNSNLSRGNNTAARGSTGGSKTGGESRAGELNKDNVTVLADKRINGLVVMARTEDIPTLESIIESMDIKLSQVLIETVIIEVGLGDGLETGVDWMQLGRQKATRTVQRTNAYGQPLYWEEGDDGKMTTTTDETDYPVMDKVTQILRGAEAGFWNGSEADAYKLGGGGGTGAGLLNSLVGVVTSNAEDVAELVSPAGSGLNYFLKSDRLNLGAVIKASKTDSRTKYIASPIIMTLDNKEATIDATEMRYLFKGYQYSGSTYNGSAVPDYEQKDLGIKLKMTPKINPNGTIMLTIEEEYSQEGSGQAITASDGKSNINAATTITRKMSADALLHNGQTVIFGGLTQTVNTEKEGGIPILKDIPWIGKWLFGYVSQNESRSELLVFMTPHVLDDSDAAEAEAIRRKKTISDPTPWDDHGWSLSKLADPVSKKEQMRRLTDEWKKQDEERKTKLAIEQAKVERAKKLQALSKEERDLWLKLHKDEIEDEQREELEKKMLDKDSQEELKELAEKVRGEKLGEANKAIKENEAQLQAENARGQLEAEKAENAEQKSALDSLATELKTKDEK